MMTSEMVKELCKKMNISISELARRIGQTSQNFGKKLRRGTLRLDELLVIADVLEITFEQKFILSNGNTINISNRNKCHSACEYIK